MLQAWRNKIMVHNMMGIPNGKPIYNANITDVYFKKMYFGDTNLLKKLTAAVGNPLGKRC
jgi:hypothetical protein